MKRHRSQAFTLIELLVVIAIIGLLSSVVLASLNTARGRARDARRLADLRQVNTALQSYYNDNGSYPLTTVTGGNIYSNWDLGCTITAGANNTKTANWVPGLVPTYIPSLPQDPSAVDRARGYNPSSTCYMYASDGKRYVLSAWGTEEGGPKTTQMYARVGFREGVFADQFVYCDHNAIGGVSPVNTDYYKYSFTLTNMTALDGSGSGTCAP